jgi:hypothetical protein
MKTRGFGFDSWGLKRNLWCVSARRYPVIVYGSVKGDFSELDR